MTAATKKVTTAKGTKTAKQTRSPKDPTKTKGVLEGQKAPQVEVPFERLNAKEIAVLRVFNPASPKRGWYTIKTLAQWAFPVLHKQNEAQSNSWTRNSLRRLVRGGWVEAPKGADRGTFMLTASGRKRLIAIKEAKSTSKKTNAKQQHAAHASEPVAATA